MIHVLVCDDDATFVENMTTRLNELALQLKRKIKVTKVVHPEYLTAKTARDIDIAFLDIDMGKINGMDIAREFRTIRNDFVLIFVTNYREYAPEGYEVRAFRYLPKDELNQKLPDYFEKALKVCREEREHIFVLCEKEDVIIAPRNLIYAETYLRSLRLHLCNTDRNTLTTHMSISALENQLQNRGFLRIHQSYLVNMNYIRLLQSTTTQLKDGTKLPTSARNYQNLKRIYLDWKGRHNGVCN